MVCLGNICRSPLAEGILKHKSTTRGLNWEIDSAGTGGWHIGEKPDRRSIRIGKKYGIDIANQRARQLQAEDLGAFDLILAMDESNYRNIIRLANTEEQAAKVKMIMEYVYPDQSVSVPDPYWGDDGFDQVYQMLEAACEKVVARYDNQQ